MPSIFISYRRADSASLSQLLEAKLAKHGIRAYVDTRKVDSAGPFPDRLRKAIAEADAFVALLGANTLDSAWVLEEIRHAHALGKPMIPVFQEKYAPPQAISDPAVNALLQFDGVHILDISNLYVDEAIKQIADMTPRKKRRNWIFAAGSIAAFLVLISAIALIVLIGQRGPEAGQTSTDMTLTGAATGSGSPDAATRTAAPSDAPDAADVDADAIAQQFRDAFNAIVAEFGHGDCIGFTPDEEFAFGANWMFSFSDEGLIDDIPISHDSAISPDGTMGAVSNDALYRFGEDTVRMFGIGGAPKFSADSRYLASDRIGIKEIASGRLVRNGRGVEQYSAISPDGQYAVLRATREENAAVIDVQADQRIIEDDGGNGFAEARFSPSGRLLAIAGLGVYDLSSRQLIIDSKETGITFSPDERIIAGGQAIADTTTGETVLELDSSVPAFFTPDSRYMTLQGVGVYDLTSMTRLFDLGDTGVAVSHNGQYVASQLTGWFRLPDGERFPIDDPADDDYYYAPPLFSADDQFVAFDGDGIYSIESGRKVLDYPHDFVAFAPGRRLILVELEDEGCALIGDSGAYSNSQPLPVE